MRQPAEQGAGYAGQQPEHRQLQAEQPECFAAGQAQAAQQCAGIKAPIGKTGCRQGNRHPGEQYRYQAGHVQIAFSLAECAADLLVAITPVEQALVGFKARLDDVTVGL